jgi:hypothetical protein
MSCNLLRSSGRNQCQEIDNRSLDLIGRWEQGVLFTCGNKCFREHIGDDLMPLKLRPLSPDLPEPVRRWAETLRQLANGAGEPSVRQLAPKVLCSAAALSRYLHGQRPREAWPVAERLATLAVTRNGTPPSNDVLRCLWEQAVQTVHEPAAHDEAEQDGQPKVARRLSQRLATPRGVAAVIVAVAILISLGWMGYKTAHHSPKAPRSGTTMSPPALPPIAGGTSTRVKATQLPVNTLSPTVAAQVGQSPGSTIAGFVFANEADNLCLSANTTGPAAGANGDKVRLWHCDFTKDEIWIPVQWETSRNNFTWLVNYQYPSKCLNADNTGGLIKGNRVQLWDCYQAVNEYWNFGDWYDSVTQQATPSHIHLKSGTFCLDADKYNLGEDDQVLIWPAYQAKNQLWY